MGEAPQPSSPDVETPSARRGRARPGPRYQARAGPGCVPARPAPPSVPGSEEARHVPQLERAGAQARPGTGRSPGRRAPAGGPTRKATHRSTGGARQQQD